MRNLKLKYCQQFELIVNNAKFLLYNYNENTSEMYVITNKQLYLTKTNTDNVEIKLLADVLSRIISGEFLVLDNLICLATEAGEVLLVDPKTLNVREGTYCDVGIEFMSWSPDQEVVVFVTRNLHVVVMSCTFDPIHEHILGDLSVEVEKQFVNVGWGKKETQFHGSEGKQAAKTSATQFIAVDISKLSQKVEVSWRGDGAFFAVSFVCLNQGRTFRVFDKEGKLQYKAEVQPNLLPPIAWRPSGNWIAVPQISLNKNIIALFEKNGLRHREIVLPFNLNDEPITQIKWSLDSEILSVQTAHTIYLYTIGNYHWYLKQVLTFKESQSVKYFFWDQRIGEEKTLHILLSDNQYLIYKWHWEIQGHLSSGLITVIDGKCLLFTNFSQVIIPPPMSAYELKLEGDFYITMFDIHLEDSEIYLAVCDSGYQLHLFKCSRIGSLIFEKVSTLQQTQTLQLTSIHWLDRDRLMTLHMKHKKSYIEIFHINDTKIYSSIMINGTITAFAKSLNDCKHWFYQVLEHTNIKSLNIFESKKCYDDIKMDQTIDKLEVFAQHPLYITVALTIQQCLYVNGKRVATDVTSFVLVSRYVVFTKLASLNFFHMDKLCIVDERRIERGAKLISIIEDSAKTILQMPRGNLELIYPRILCLKLIDNLLDIKQYNKAFDILRKQRINLNILCDYNVSKFLESLDDFFREIKNPNWLNLFISDLQNEDCTVTMYDNIYAGKSKHYPENFKIQEKITYICKALLAYMEQSSEKHYRLPIITAYVKLGELEKALKLIWEEKKQKPAEAEESLKYLLYLVDIDELYNVALGTYDFNLVLFVTQKSQKDPKEILCFLNQLKTYEINYKKFKIDEHLKRYDKALVHIAQCSQDRFDEALTFIKRHNCFKLALKAYQDQEEFYNSICSAFADYLRANGNLEEASIMYERSGNFTQALLSAKHMLDWERVLILAAKSQQDVSVVAQSLVLPLKEQNKYKEAFELLKEYGDDFEIALKCLIEGKLFLKAIFEIERSGFNDNLLNAVLKEELLAYYKYLLDSLIKDTELFNNYKQRLHEVRIKHSKRTAMNESMDLIDNIDLLSDTSSLHSSSISKASRTTGKTFRSSKNRRKHERKILNLKPGNAFEDIALIDALHNQITNCINQQQHIRDTCKACLMLNLDDAAAELQKKFKLLIQLMQNSLDDIWTPEILVTQEFIQGPTIDYTQLQNEQRYALLNPLKRFKPQLKITNWPFELIL